MNKLLVLLAEKLGRRAVGFESMQHLEVENIWTSIKTIIFDCHANDPLDFEKLLSLVELHPNIHVIAYTDKKSSFRNVYTDKNARIAYIQRFSDLMTFMQPFHLRAQQNF